MSGRSWLIGHLTFDPSPGKAQLPLFHFIYGSLQASYLCEQSDKRGLSFGQIPNLEGFFSFCVTSCLSPGPVLPPTSQVGFEVSRGLLPVGVLRDSIPETFSGAVLEIPAVPFPFSLLSLGGIIPVGGEPMPI